MSLLRTLLAATCLLGTFTGAQVRGDVLYKRDGGFIEGEILSDKSDAKQVTIKSRFGTIEIPRSNVKEITYSRTAKEKYAERAAEAKPDADSQYELAVWCLEEGLREKYQEHLEKVIKLDPNHAEARRRLGYELQNGKWLTEEESMAAKGYVQYRGKWMLPQERAEAERRNEDDQSRRELAHKIRVAQKFLRQSSRPERQQQGEAELRSIDDDLAVPLLMTFLAEKGTDAERRLLVDVLDNIEGPESTDALVRLTLDDPIHDNRMAAAESLSERKSPSLLGRFASELKSNENDHVRRSAMVLETIGDTSVVPALVDALVTEHKIVIEPTFEEIATSHQFSTPQQLTKTVILPDGTIVRRNLFGGLNPQNTLSVAPPQRRVIVETKKNLEVLSALEAITGENLGFDEDAWRSWLKTEYRRDAAKLP